MSGVEFPGVRIACEFFHKRFTFPRFMMGDPGDRRPAALVYRYSGLGCMFAAAVLLFMAAGWLLDRWLGVLPVFTVLAALVGAALGTYSVYRKVMEMDDR